ncbi:MAG: hypothetical protein LAQ69_10675 [Acidobacteriia bacterium]|nr:hypothetical protein [Terriglobia bacterium]
MKVKLSMLAATVCTLLVAIPLTAANGPAAKTNKKMTTTAAMRSAWPPETISGKITLVNPDQKLVVVEPPSGVPFDMVVTAKTLIKSGDQVVTLNDLTQDVNKTVSVRFTPERRGDVAKSIQIGG